jgi:putative polyhydroxyalkanoate system protein
MPKLNFSIPHGQSQEDARRRLLKFMDGLRERFQDQVSDLQESWEGNRLDYSFRAFRIRIQGNVTVGPDDLTVLCELPFSAMMFKGKIESEIRQQLVRVMA